MAKTEYTGQSDDQLVEALGNLKREQFSLRFQAATSQLEKPSRSRSPSRHRADQDHPGAAHRCAIGPRHMPKRVLTG